MILFLIENVTILTKYTDFANVFSKKLVEMLSERTVINEYAIELVDSKQPLYGLI